MKNVAHYEELAERAQFLAKIYPKDEHLVAEAARFTRLMAVIRQQETA